MSKPKILFILHMPPPVHGAAMMGKYIHDSKVVNEAFDCRYVNLATAASLEDIGGVSFTKLKKIIGLFREVRREVKAFRPDLVYVTPSAAGGSFLMKDFPLVQMLKRMGCRVVVHYHNKGVAKNQGSRIYDFAYRRFFRGIKVILLAEALYKDVQKYVRREDVFICPNGIPETVVGEPKAERHNAVPHLLFLSNLLVSKGVYVLLDALKILKDRGYSFVCNFVGGETAEINAEQFRQEVEQRRLNQVAVYQGRKYGAEKEQFWQDADIFVFPSSYDCFPLVLIEAMQHSLPCISTNEGGIPNIVDDGSTGVIVPQHSPEALADSLAQLMDNEALRTEMGRKGREKYEAEFRLERFEHRITEILKKNLC